MPLKPLAMSLPRLPRSRPRPKLRSIPRRKAESALYAEMQQLSAEKQRLNQELEFLQERQEQIQARLQEIEQALQHFQQAAEAFRNPVSSPKPSPASFSPSRFLSMTFEY
jgi:predicted  nucleic acid-binding Zn-ribbon protein